MKKQPSSAAVAGRENRKKYDMQQAAAMRGNSNASIPVHDMTEEDVTMAMRGLDMAKDATDSGNTQEAMRLYEVSIEMLIHYLNHAKRSNDTRGALPPPFDQSVIAEAVRVALTQAEELKATLNKKDNSRPSFVHKKKPSDQRTDTWNSTATTLSSKLTSAKNESRGGHPNNHASSSSSRQEKGTHRTTRNAPQHLPTAHGTHGTRRSQLDYDKDPLVQMVKNDLYVESSMLHTSWNDIAGLAVAKRSLQEAAILPLLRPDLYTGLRQPPKGILLYGPPGTGKTMLVKAVAHESKCLLFACTASALTSKWHGEGEKLVRTLFRVASDVSPAIVFLDEIDSLLSSRGGGNEHEASRRFKTEFMVQMDGIIAGKDDNSNDVQQRVLVLGCTNCPWDIDDAVMRRFQRRIYVPLPDGEARRAMIEGMLRKSGNTHNLTSRQVTKLVAFTDGYSCSDIASIANEAAFGPLRSVGDLNAIRDVKTADVRPISYSDFEDAIRNTSKSVSSTLLAKYQQWERSQAATG